MYSDTFDFDAEFRHVKIILNLKIKMYRVLCHDLHKIEISTFKSNVQPRDTHTLSYILHLEKIGNETHRKLLIS